MGAIAAIDEWAWIPDSLPEAFVVTDTGQLVSDAVVAEIDYAAFTSRPKRGQVPPSG